MIPRIFHAWWGGPPMPDHMREYLDLWQDMHPKWEVRLWTPENTPHLGDHQDLFDNPEKYSPKSNPWQWRSDLSRYRILHDVGGVYIDCDLEPLKPVDPLTEGVESVIAREDRRHINNAFMGSAPGSKFLRSVLKGLRASVESQPNSRVNRQIGAHYLTRLARRHPELRILPSKLIYPEHWSNLDALNQEPPKDAYTRHHWWNKQTETGVAKV